MRLYYADFDGDGIEELIEAYDEPGLKKVVPEHGLDFVARAMPFLRERFTTHQAYAEASVQELLGERFKRAEVIEVNWLENTVFLNRGTRFEAQALPVEAQMAPAFGICVGDCNGDGKEDIFLSQNFFATQPETPRYDAGRGLWLKGNGQGGFTAMSGQVSGIKIYGEQRGCALADYDKDGRVDLVVAQNGAATKLYHNVGAKPGLRVQLAGPANNPTGVGATVRVVFRERMGPAREIHAGSGYWSQDSAVAVLGTPEEPTQIWVRWPGGKTITAAIPKGAKEVVIDPEGRLK